MPQFGKSLLWHFYFNGKVQWHSIGINFQINKCKENKNVQDHHNHHDHGGYGVDHTTIIYLMDKKGNYLTHFSPDTTNTQLVKKINQYL